MRSTSYPRQNGHCSRPLSALTTPEGTDAAGADDDDAWRISNRAFKEVVATEDFREGPRAFLEKRPPRWTGR